MSIKMKTILVRFLPVLLTLFLASQIPIVSQASPAQAGNPLQEQAALSRSGSPETLAVFSPNAPVDCADTDCPAQDAGFGGLDQCVQRDDFCIYYDSGTTSEARATFAANQIQAYWTRFTALGFNEPKRAHPADPNARLKVYITTDASCNGGTGWDLDYMTTYNGCWTLGDDVAQMTLGHELTHRVQYNYDTSAGAPIQTKFLKEGTARATQDNWFDNIDDQPAGAASFTYCAEAAGYLAATNNDLSDMWYTACVWWKWAMEQYGTTLTEPQRGIDFVEAVYDQNTLGKSRIAAVNGALAIKAPGTTFDESFTQFAVAAYTKDLTGVPDDSYNILDEEEAAGPGTCGSVTAASKGAISTGTNRQWNNEAISKYGIKYYQASIGATCPVLYATFHNDGGPAFYHVVTQNGSAFKTHTQGSGTDWTQAFMNDGATTKIVAVVGSLDNASQVDVTLGCADPVIDIKMPNTGAPTHVQANNKFLAQVLVTNGAASGPVVAGLSNSDFSARVGGANAAIVGGGFIQEQYWLVIRAPAGLADDTYDLEILLEEPGSSDVIDTDTEFQSVIYTSDKVDHVLVIDRSGSMGIPIEPTNAKLNAAKDAAKFYVDITRTSDGLAVVPYNHDVDPTLVLDMIAVTAGVRTDAKDNYITPLTASGATSIGDGLGEAVDQYLGSPTGNPLCSFVLLSDGMENTPQYWADVQADVQATGCPVTTIAFGPESNETLMQTIATDTGGLSFYNDVYVSTELHIPNATTPATMTLELGNTYEYIQGQEEGRQRFVADLNQVTYGITQTYEIIIDDSVSEALFAINWVGYGSCRKGCPHIQLIQPDGNVYDEPYDFLDYDTGHMGWRVLNPAIGVWQMQVFMFIEPYLQPTAGMPFQVTASGHSDLTLDLILPGAFDVFSTGFSFPIFAILSDDGPVPCEGAAAIVTAPDGTETRLPLFDDGQHEDGAAGDGVCANRYTRANQSLLVQPADEGASNPTPLEEGGYQVELDVINAHFMRQALGAFAITEGADSDGDGMPDVWEDDHGLDKDDPNDADLDPDLDYLTNAEEYLNGTDPNNSDSDGGGENDGSEVSWGQDPLDPADDQIEAPDFFHAAPLNGKVQLTFDVKGEYVKMELWRAPAPEGPWDLRVSEMPLEGAYQDPASNGTTYYYRLIAEDLGALAPSTGHRSAVLQSESVTPSIDPVPPQAKVVINGGDSLTRVADVILTFEPYEYEPEDPDGFSDITEMMLSNDPSFTGATWQPFDQDVDWTLVGPINALNYVYARFRDAHNNESVGTEADVILYEPYTNYLSIIVK